MSKTNYERKRALDGRYGGGTYSKPATVYCALFLAAPALGGTYSEANYPSYARVAKTNNSTNFPDTDLATGQKSNGTVVTFPQRTAGGSANIATHFGWLDAATGGNLQDFAPLTTLKEITTDDIPEFGVGQLLWTET